MKKKKIQQKMELGEKVKRTEVASGGGLSIRGLVSQLKSLLLF